MLSMINPETKYGVEEKIGETIWDLNSDYILFGPPLIVSSDRVLGSGCAKDQPLVMMA